MTQAEWQGKLQQAGTELQARLEKSAKRHNPLVDYWQGMSDPTRQSLRNAALGALLGGAAGGGYGLATSDPEDRAGQTLRNLLMGAGLGGAAGGAGTAGLNLLRGSIKLPGEDSKGWHPLSNAFGSLGSTVIGHPATAVGATLGGYATYKHAPTGRNLIQLLEQKLKDLRGTPEEANIGEALRRVRELHVSKPSSLGAAAGEIRAAGKGPAAQQLIKAVRTGDVGRIKVLLRRLPGGRVPRMLRVMQQLKIAPVPSRAMFAALPLAAGGGYLLDKYLKGEY